MSHRRHHREGGCLKRDCMGRTLEDSWLHGLITLSSINVRIKYHWNTEAMIKDLYGNDSLSSQPSNIIACIVKIAPQAASGAMPHT